MIYIFCALKCEASPIIQSLALNPVPGARNVYEGGSIILHVTGIGAARMGALLENFTPLPDSHFINTGICGCSDESVKVGTPFLLNEIRDSEAGIPLYPDMLVNTTLEEAGCTSYPSPKTSGQCPTMLADMEARSFFSGCLKFADIDRIHAIKVVSDHMKSVKLSKNEVSGIMHKAAKPISDYIGLFMNNGVTGDETGYAAYYDKYRFTASMRAELDRLNKYHELRYKSRPGPKIYSNHGIPAGKKDSMRIFNVIKEKLI